MWLCWQQIYFRRVSFHILSWFLQCVIRRHDGDTTKWEVFKFYILNWFFFIFLFRQYFFSGSFFEVILVTSVFELEQRSFRIVSTWYPMTLAENLAMIGSKLRRQLFPKMLCKFVFFRKSAKKFARNGWTKQNFFLLFKTLGTIGNHLRSLLLEFLKKTYNHCNLLYNVCVDHN